jgi:hypothetical protein
VSYGDGFVENEAGDKDPKDIGFELLDLLCMSGCHMLSLLVWRMRDLLSAFDMLPDMGIQVTPGYCFNGLVQSDLPTDVGIAESTCRSGLHLWELLV